MSNFLKQINRKIFFIKNSLIGYLYSRKRKYVKKTNELSHLFYNSNKTKLYLEKQTIVYLADGKVQIGGLADRLRGITSVFEYCKNNNIDFKIYFNKPFELTEYLVPNKYNWTINSDELSYNSEEAVPLYFVMSNESVIISPLNIEEKFQKFLLKKLLKQKTNQIHIYTNSLAYGKRFGVLFNQLFKPSQALQESLLDIKKILGENYLSISTRFLELLGDFIEPNAMRTPLNEESQCLLMNWCLRQIGIIQKKYCKNGEKIFVTSDSQKFLSAVKNKPGIVVFEGKIEHSDSTVCDSDSNKKLFLDFFTIANADKVFLLVGPNMYTSNFCKRASMINNKEFFQIKCNRFN